MFDAIAVAGEWSGAVEFVDGFVQFLMRLAQLVRHDVDIEGGNVLAIGQDGSACLAQARKK